jgi:molybdopterin-guanine dinucleotide biosynthesis protein A
VHRGHGTAAGGAGAPGESGDVHGGPAGGAETPGVRRAVHRSAKSALSADAIVLAGGRGSRLGGADKPAVLVGERSMISSVVSAAAEAGARRVVVVGPARPELSLANAELRVVREEPPGSGPVPALRRGLAEAGAPLVLLLAADLPFLRAAHLCLLLDAAAGAPGAVLADDGGREQWLAGCWQTAALRRAIEGYRGGSLHALLRPLSPVILAPQPGQAGPPPWLDCDTEEDVRLARAACSVSEASGGGAVMNGGGAP